MKKSFFKILFIYFFLQSNIFADTVKEILVNGNNRVSKSTIINFSDIKVNDNVNDDILNQALKNLYETNFFENIEIFFDDGILKIELSENLIIENIIINGIKSNDQKKQIKDFINSKEKSPFSKILFQNDLNNLNNFFKRSGFYFSKIEEELVQKENSTIDLIINIDRGEKATIKDIKFIGEKIFKDKKLKSIIVSEEDKFWKLISKKKFLNIEQINLDKRLLESFYKNKGYYNVKIFDAYSKILNNNDFEITYNIEAGNKYFFNELSLSLPDDYNIADFRDLTKLFNKLKGEPYSLTSINQILEVVDEITLLNNYEFIDVEVNENIVDKSKINFIFNVKESENLYVNRINIYGNNTTTEKFIRNNLIVDEGDPLNNILQNKSINNLRSKGIFKSVNFKVLDTSDDLKKDIDLIFEERPTGEISAAAGYGTDGSTLSFGIVEKNFKGEGINISSDLSLGEDSIRGSLFYTEPNFMYSDKDLTTSLESTKTDKLSDYGYENSLNSFGIGTSYEQYKNLFFSPKFKISNETLKTTSSASSAYKKQAGTYFDTNFSYAINYDQRNQKFQPTKGYISTWSQDIPLFSDNPSIINGYSFTTYNEIIDNMIITSGLFLRSINTLNSDEDVRVSKRLYMPSTRLRGFESGKVGPKDSGDFIGGNYLASFNNSATLPFILEGQENLDIKLFVDMGNIWGVDYSSLVGDSNKLRTSTGLALEILTPVGPLTFSYAEVISKAETDKVENFRFQLGTTF
jgi:outer membrane protein insertion porin family